MVVGVSHIIKKLYERVPASGRLRTTAVENSVLIQTRFEAETEWLEVTKGALWLGHCMRQPVRGNWPHVLARARVPDPLCSVSFLPTVPSLPAFPSAEACQSLPPRSVSVLCS